VTKILNTSPRYQCGICPSDFDKPVLVSQHMAAMHNNFLHLILGKRDNKGEHSYLYCRHCHYVTTKKAAMWYHFVLVHEVTVLSHDIKVCGIDVQSSQLITTNADLKTASVAYMCLACKGVELDRSRLVAHVLRKHPNSPSILSGFVKVREINLMKVTVLSVQ
jgi:hypothetical protein